MADLVAHPSSVDEWRAVATAAAGLLLIDDARLFGLVRGGPTVVRVRCEPVLATAAEVGIVPTPEEANAAAMRVIAAVNAEAGTSA
jgi:hypothetical protein